MNLELDEPQNIRFATENPNNSSMEHEPNIENDNTSGQDLLEQAPIAEKEEEIKMMQRKRQIEDSCVQLLDEKEPGQRTDADLTKLRNWWQLNHFQVFGGLNERELLNSFLQNARLLHIHKNTPVFLQGQPNCGYFVVLSGEVRISKSETWVLINKLRSEGYGVKLEDLRASLPIDLKCLPHDYKHTVLGTTVGIVPVGCGFGELPQGKQAHQISAATLENSAMLYTGIKMYEDILNAQPSLHLNVWDRIQFLTCLPLFRAAHPSVVSSIAFKLQSTVVRPGKHIVNERDAVSEVIIIRAGEAQIANLEKNSSSVMTKDEKALFNKVSKCMPGSMIGVLEYLSKKEAHKHGIVASCMVEILKMTLEDLDRLRRNCSTEEVDTYVHEENARIKFRKDKKMTTETMKILRETGALGDRTTINSLDKAVTSALGFESKRLWELSRGGAKDTTKTAQEEAADAVENASSGPSLAKRKDSIISKLTKSIPTDPSIGGLVKANSEKQLVFNLDTNIPSQDTAAVVAKRKEDIMKQLTKQNSTNSLGSFQGKSKWRMVQNKFSRATTAQDELAESAEVDAHAQESGQTNTNGDHQAARRQGITLPVSVGTRATRDRNESFFDKLKGYVLNNEQNGDSQDNAGTKPKQVDSLRPRKHLHKIPSQAALDNAQESPSDKKEKRTPVIRGFGPDYSKKKAIHEEHNLKAFPTVLSSDKDVVSSQEGQLLKTFQKQSTDTQLVCSNEPVSRSPAKRHPVTAGSTDVSSSKDQQKKSAFATMQKSKSIGTKNNFTFIDPEESPSATRSRLTGVLDKSRSKVYLTADKDQRSSSPPPRRNDILSFFGGKKEKQLVPKRGSMELVADAFIIKDSHQNTRGSVTIKKDNLSTTFNKDGQEMLFSDLEVKGSNPKRASISLSRDSSPKHIISGKDHLDKDKDKFFADHERRGSLYRRVSISKPKENTAIVQTSKDDQLNRRRSSIKENIISIVSSKELQLPVRRSSIKDPSLANIPTTEHQSSHHKHSRQPNIKGNTQHSPVLLRQRTSPNITEKDTEFSFANYNQKTSSGLDSKNELSATVVLGQRSSPDLTLNAKGKKASTVVFSERTSTNQQASTMVFGERTSTKQQASTMVLGERTSTKQHASTMVFGERTSTNQQLAEKESAKIPIPTAGTSGLKRSYYAKRVPSQQLMQAHVSSRNAKDVVTNGIG